MRAKGKMNRWKKIQQENRWGIHQKRQENQERKARWEKKRRIHRKIREAGRRFQTSQGRIHQRNRRMET
ncbi:unknown [Clostridium sp. CAG:149]|nr:unknown [Clostridium sp. CAG:149]